MKTIPLVAIAAIAISTGCTTSQPKASDEEIYVKFAERALRPQQESSDALNEILKDSTFKEIYAKNSMARIDGATIRNPQLKHMVKPDYPKWRQLTRTESRIFVGIIVDEKGKVLKLKLVPQVGWSLNDEFTKSIETAISQWSFAPAEIDGQPSKSIVVAPVIFDL